MSNETWKELQRMVEGTMNGVLAYLDPESMRTLFGHRSKHYPPQDDYYRVEEREVGSAGVLSGAESHLVGSGHGLMNHHVASPTLYGERYVDIRLMRYNRNLRPTHDEAMDNGGLAILSVRSKAPYDPEIAVPLANELRLRTRQLFMEQWFVMAGVNSLTGAFPEFNGAGWNIDHPLR